MITTRRVLFSGTGVSREDGLQRAAAHLAESGIESQVSESDPGLLEDVVRHPPDVLVFELAEDPANDLAFLKLIRRLYPILPLVVLGHGGRLGVRRVVQSLNPVYFGVIPVDGIEIEEAVTAALRRVRPGQTNHEAPTDGAGPARKPGAGEGKTQ